MRNNPIVIDKSFNQLQSEKKIKKDLFQDFNSKSIISLQIERELKQSIISYSKRHNQNDVTKLANVIFLQQSIPCYSP